MMKGFLRTLPALAMFSASTLFMFSSPAWAQTAPMLTYEIQHELLASPDRYSVVVYQDGLAIVHYPEFMENAGDYTVRLRPDEVQMIRLLLEHPLVQDFNVAAVRAHIESIEAQSQELFHISDDSHSEFSIDTNGNSKNIHWTNLEVDANRFPGIGVLKKLAEIEATLQNLGQHPTAQRVDDQGGG